MNRGSWVRRIAAIMIVVFPLALGALISRKAVDIPFWDEWEWTDLIYSLHHGTLQFADIWAQHSEHRILTSNLIMLGLDRFGGWDPVREQYVSLAVLVLCQLAIIVMIRRSAHGTAGVLAAAAASLLLYSLAQAENFSWGFQMEWFICNACAVGVAFFLTKPQRGPVHVLLAMLVALVGTYSASQGVLAWAVGVVAILLTFRKRTFTLIFWIPTAILAYLVYRNGLLQVDTGHFDVFAHPFVAVRYVLAYLGAPIAWWAGANGCTVAGLVMIAMLATSFAIDVGSPYRIRRLVRNAPWYALAVFPVLCALGTAIGRAGFGISQALAGRYTTVSTLGWVAIIGLLVGLVARLPRPLSRRTYAALLATSLAFVVTVLLCSVQGLQQWRVTAATLVGARSELIRSDPAALPKLYPVPQRVIMLIGKMRDVHDGLFASP